MPVFRSGWTGQRYDVGILAGVIQDHVVTDSHNVPIKPKPADTVQCEGSGEFLTENGLLVGVI